MSSTGRPSALANRTGSASRRSRASLVPSSRVTWTVSRRTSKLTNPWSSIPGSVAASAFGPASPLSSTATRTVRSWTRLTIASSEASLAAASAGASPSTASRISMSAAMDPNDCKRRHRRRWVSSGHSLCSSERLNSSSSVRPNGHSPSVRPNGHSPSVRPNDHSPSRRVGTVIPVDGPTPGMLTILDGATAPPAAGRAPVRFGGFVERARLRLSDGGARCA